MIYATRLLRFPASRWLLLCLCVLGVTGACQPEAGSWVSEEKAGGGGHLPSENEGSFAPTVDDSPTGLPLRSVPSAQDLNDDPGIVEVNLSATRIPVNLRPDPGIVSGYSFRSPGPVIRARLGDTLVVNFSNRLATPTSVHWHGLHVPFDMDGALAMPQVEEMTEDEHGLMQIPTDAAVRYEFQVNQPGTFWYHPHFDTSEQVDEGLFGVIVVEDPRDPVVDEMVLVLDALGEQHGGMTDRPAGHGALNTRWRVNGLRRPVWTPASGSVVRLRFVNVSNVSYVSLTGPEWRVIALDQGILAAPQSPERLLLGPGDRAEVELLVGDEAFDIVNEPWSINGGRTWAQPETLIRVEPTGDLPAPPPVNWPFTGTVATPDPGYADIVWTFAGDDRSEEWFINGRQFPDIEIETVRASQPPIMEIRNLSPTEHPFHTHGMDFEVLSINGTPLEYQVIEDTINLRIGDIVRVRLRPVFPGLWMAHCHILPHADLGMMSLINVIP
jgi:FtsP/CotA-like multicopper oxidase with cupredoxin domain